MIIALFTNVIKNHTKPIALSVKEFLESQGVKVVVEDEQAQDIGAQPLSSVDPKKIDFLLSLGGDGTILRVFHTHPEIDAPIMGINLGGLGFMADVTIEELFPSLESLLRGECHVQNRMMMQGATIDHQTCFAINDIVIHRAHNPSLIDLAIYVDGNYLNTFSADGVIIATPNGSTAYSLASGGPILAPELNAFVITPICPHTISNRPIVLMPKREIEVRYISEYPSIEVVYDGFAHYELHPGEVFRISSSERKFRLVNMLNYDFFATVRSKLGWSGRLKK